MIEHTQSNGATFMPRFRPRISILTALLLTTIVGMAIVLVQLWKEVEPATFGGPSAPGSSWRANHRGQIQNSRDSCT